MSQRSCLTILLIDDSTIDRMALRRFLKQDHRYTYRILEFNRATAAMQWCQQEIPDVILLDFSLPDDNGLEFLQQLREQVRNTQSAVILLTGQGDETIAVSAMKSGAQDYLVKDKLTPEALQGAIYHAVERIHLNRQLEQSREQQQLINAIALRIHQSLNLAEILRVTATEVREFLVTDRVIVYQFQPDMDGKIVAESVVPGLTVALGKQIQDTCFQQQQAAAEYNLGKKRAIDDIYLGGLKDCHLQMLEQFEVKANLVVPILVADQLWGLLIAHQCSASRDWQAVEIDLLEQLAVQIAIAIQQASAYEQLQAELLERQRTQAALQLSEEKLKLTLNLTHIGYWEWNPTCNEIFLSENTIGCFDFDTSDSKLTKNQILSLIHPEDRQWVTREFSQAIATKSDYAVEYRVLWQDGSIHWLAQKGKGVYDESGQLLRMLGVLMEISDRKQAEEDLRESEERFRSIFEQAAVGISHVSLAGKFIRLNQRFCEIADYPQAELQTLTFQDITHPEDLAADLEQVEKLLAGEILTYSMEKRYIRKDGSSVWINLTVSLVRDRFDEPNYLISVIEDITWRKQAEAALRQNEERLQQLNQELEDRVEQRTAALRESEERWHLAVRGSNDGIWDWNIQTNEVFLSARWQQMRGFVEHEINYNVEQWLNQIHPDDCDRVLTALSDHLARKSPLFHEEYRFKCKDGSYLWVLDRGQALWDQTGNPIRIAGSGTDISDRKAAEAQLLSITRLQQAILESSDYGIISLTLEGVIQTFNPAAQKILGYTADEVVGKLTTVMFHDPQELQQRAAALSWQLGREIAPGLEFFTAISQQKQNYEQEWTYIRKDGSRFPVLLSITPLHDAKGQMMGLLGIAKDITQQKQMAAQIRKSAAHLATAQRIANLGSWEFDLQTQAIVWSEQVFRIFGRDLESGILSYEEMLQYVHPDDREHRNFVMAQAIALGQSYELESRFYRQDGSLCYLLSRGEAILDADGKPIQLIGTILDITERKQFEEQLRSLSDRLTLALKAGAIGTWDWDLLHNPYWDDRMYELYGMQKSDPVAYQDWVNALHLEDVAPVEAALQAALRGEKEFTPEFRAIHPDSSIHFIKAAAVVQRDEQGEPIRMVGINYDITERKQIEQALRESERRYATLAEASPVAIFRLDADSNCVYANDRATEMTGRQTQALMGMGWVDTLHPKDRDRLLGEWSQALEQQGAYRSEGRFLRSDGNIIWFYIQVLPETDTNNSIIGYIGTITDITDRKLAEEELVRNKQLREVIFNESTDALFLVDPQTLLTLDCNQRAVEVFEVADQAELIGIEGHTLQRYQFSTEEMAAIVAQMQSKGFWSREIEYVTRQDNFFWGNIAAKPITVAGRNLNLVRVTDISDRKQTEQQLRQTNEQLARATRLKDEFLANMSHELRTPLNAILGMSEGFLEGVFGSINQRQAKAIATIERSGQHLLELINDILDLSKIESGKMELQLSEVSISSLCDASLAFIKQMALKKNISLKTSIANNIGKILVDDRRLRQVLINLLNNAVKFTSAGGSVMLEVKLETAGEVIASYTPNHTLWKSSDPEPNLKEIPHLCFSVIDTGIGIARENIGKLFQPFVQLDSSLNRQYSGTGLGLALVQRIASLHGGTVSLSSEVDRGSCFTVRIPYKKGINSPITQVITPLPSCRLPGANSPVLIIEDSVPAAEQMTRYLNEMDMQPIVYSQGEGVINEVLRVQPVIIFLDIQLPNLSGWDVLNQLKANPKTKEIPVIIISVVDECTTGIVNGACEYLVKPITRTQFQATIEKVQHLTHPGSSAGMEVQLPDIKTPLILLAEDNQANIDTMSGYLESRGYRLVLAKNGQQAIDFAKSQRPDLIVMDIQMPVMDGLEAMRRIREESQILHVPIIALTALAMSGDREICLAAGANEYLTKPVKLKQLAITIQQLLAK